MSASDELVERLRRHSQESQGFGQESTAVEDDCAEAADHIEALTAEIEHLREREAEAVGLLREAKAELPSQIMRNEETGLFQQATHPLHTRITTHLQEQPDG